MSQSTPSVLDFINTLELAISTGLQDNSFSFSTRWRYELQEILEQLIRSKQ